MSINWGKSEEFDGKKKIRKGTKESQYSLSSW